MALRALVTREKLEPLGRALAALGLEPVHLPLVGLVGTGAPPPVVAPAQVLLTSAVGVQHAAGLAGWAEGARVVVVGAATRRAAERAGLVVAACGEAGGAEALDLVEAQLVPTVYVGALRPAPAVAAALEAGRLVHWAVYDRVEVTPCQPEAVDVVTLASPSAALAWARVPGAAALPVVAIGQTTAQAAVEAGLRVAAVAERPDLEALAAAARAVVGP